MTKIYSWNVNGIRAVLKKDALQPFLDKEQPDILCLQETKAKQEQVELSLPDYRQFWYSADKPGYSGTAIFTKEEPLQVINGFPEDIIKQFGVTGDTFGDPNKEGRVMAAEFENFWVSTVYTPNAKDDLGRLQTRHKQWDPAFLAYMKALETGSFQGYPLLQGVPLKVGERCYHYGNDYCYDRLTGCYCGEFCECACVADVSAGVGKDGSPGSKV